MATTAAPITAASPAAALDPEIFDAEPTIEASGQIAPLLRDWNELVRAEIGSVQSFAVYDRDAQSQQAWHQWLVAVAAIAGSTAVLLAILQLATFARPLLLETPAAAVLAGGEYVAAILAIIAVVLGLSVAFHTRWRVLRMKAEQYRFLKAHYLLHAAQWLSRAPAERSDYLRTMLAGIHALDSGDAHHWAQGTFSLFRDEPASLAATDAPLAAALVRYLRVGRIESQRDYFIVQTRRRHDRERGTWFIPPACFFLSIVFAFAHFAVEIWGQERHSADAHAEVRAVPAKKPHHTPTALMIGCLLGAAAFPVLGAMVRTMRTAFEFGRNANRFEGVAHVLDEIDGQLALPLPPAAQMELLREAHRMLQHENRSWMRLMIEAEWFG